MTDDEKFTRVVRAKIATLEDLIDGSCAICGETVRHWGVCIPEGDADALGFGSKNENTARVAFFPVCKIHDMNTAENIEKVRQALITKKQTMSN